MKKNILALWPPVGVRHRKAVHSPSVTTAMPELPRGTIIRFRSGVNYDYVAVSLGDKRFRTTARVERADDSAPINRFGWNPVNKIEYWADLIARTNTFSVATKWAAASAILEAEHAVVRFTLKGSQEWDAAIHVGDGSWYSTVLETGEGGLHYLDYPHIRSLSDIVNNSSRIELAKRWWALDDVGLPPYR
ncbi:hypothetical protein [Mycobacterium sp. 94-17]|uniref:hypothetical protein n=1 Tax=Mycobacterium sp. 94-17 TaxID=2986147 RepID=UPI002D1F8E5F|nr:hypothetical protein [Mycobacterium sp. 94-17]MEB4208739.1 hypothetical protein [Mycobacterium sp. 94-17]